MATDLLKMFKMEAGSGKAHFSMDRMSPLLAYWCLRLLLAKRGRLRHALNQPGGAVRAFCTELGLPESAVEDEAGLLARLQEHAIDLAALNPRFGGRTGRNLESLARQLGFSPLERDVLGFILLIKRDPTARELVDTLYQTAPEQLVVECLSTALGADARAVGQALRPDSRLCRSGLVKIERTIDWTFTDRIEVRSGLSDAVCSEGFDLAEVMRHAFAPAAESRLSPADFEHMGSELRVLRQYLSRALAERRRGANVLVVGAPGTGKTELCRLLAAELETEAWEIAAPEGNPLRTNERLESLALAQEMLASAERPLIIFDEIEDAFGRDRSLGYENKVAHTKAWMNQRLVDNPVPTLWISNAIDRIDGAHLRRFDLLIAMPPASRHLRTRLVRETLPDTLQESDLARRLVDDRDNTPAELAVLGRLASTLDAGNEPEQLATDLDRLVKHRHRIMRSDDFTTRAWRPDHYRLEWLNPSEPVEPIFRGLMRSRKGRILLHGPPGTGKTAFADYLSRELDCPLIRKSYSQLVSCWLGESEKNIRNLFEEATREGAVLMLDEADSLLRDRQAARASWEVSQTNEILQQMEDFDGIFIAATNRMEQIEPAAMRRFDWRLTLDWLRPEQVLGLARETLNRHGQPAPTSEQSEALERTTPVAPGDFRVAERQVEVLGEALTAEGLIETLRGEASRRNKDRDGIGFLADVS